MYRLAWATDLHLNVLRDPDAVDHLGRALAATASDGFVISGDIGTARSVEGYLRTLEQAVARPIFFVLGNHDFYYGSIPKVRAAMAALTADSRHLRWLPAVGVVELTPETALVGHDGWADGRFGDLAGTRVEPNDFSLILELLHLDPQGRQAWLQTLGDEAAAYVRRVLPVAFERFRRVVLATHVPPFREACRRGGRPCDDDHLPHFGCRALGDALVEIMGLRPDRTLTVICGHTHDEVVVRVLPNLEVLVGGVEYGAPALQRVLEIP